MKTLFVLICLLFSQSALAASTWFMGSIKRLYPLSTGDIVVIFNEENTSCTNASDPKYHYLTVGKNGVTQDGRDVMYSSLLTAATTGKKVSINFDSDSEYCYINRLIVRFDS